MPRIDTIKNLYRTAIVARNAELDAGRDEVYKLLEQAAREGKTSLELDCRYLGTLCPNVPTTDFVASLKLTMGTEGFRVEEFHGAPHDPCLTITISGWA